MADYDSSLPARTESAGDIDVFISDATVSTQKLKVNADGSIDATQASGDSYTVDAVQLDVDDLTFANDKVDASGSTGLEAVVTATQLDVDDLNATDDAVSAHIKDESGNAFSLTNPLPVEFVDGTSGDEIVNYNTSAAVAKDASVNHDYTVTTSKTLLIDQVWASASGKMKVEVLVNAVTKYVGFNSTANPNIEIPMKKILHGLTTEVVRITLTNKDKQAQDLYSTLSGLEI